MTTALLMIGSILTISTFAPDGDGTVAASALARKGDLPDFTAEREAAARAFVRLHHPELNALLDRLKPMNPVEYEKAIAALFQVSEDLAAMKRRDPKRYPLALTSWKAKSRVEVLAAQWARKPGPEAESSLRQAIETQLQCELAIKRYERDLIESRLRKVQTQVERLETDRDKLVETRLNSLLKKAHKTKSSSSSSSVNVKAVAKSASPASPKGDAKP